MIFPPIASWQAVVCLNSEPEFIVKLPSICVPKDPAEYEVETHLPVVFPPLTITF